MADFRETLRCDLATFAKDTTCKISVDSNVRLLKDYE